MTVLVAIDDNDDVCVGISWDAYDTEKFSVRTFSWVRRRKDVCVCPCTNIACEKHQSSVGYLSLEDRSG